MTDVVHETRRRRPTTAPRRRARGDRNALDDDQRDFAKGELTPELAAYRDRVLDRPAVQGAMMAEGVVATFQIRASTRAS
jgi:hypothetical protein